MPRDRHRSGGQHCYDRGPEGVTTISKFLDPRTALTIHDLFGYGASGKATTLLNALGLRTETIEYATDSTAIKHGCVISGTTIPIKPPETLLTDTPDYLLLLAWNYADAILNSERALRARGAKFILPVPKLQIV